MSQALHEHTRSGGRFPDRAAGPGRASDWLASAAFAGDRIGVDSGRTHATCEIAHGLEAGAVISADGPVFGLHKHGASAPLFPGRRAMALEAGVRAAPERVASIERVIAAETSANVASGERGRVAGREASRRSKRGRRSSPRGSLSERNGYASGGNLNARLNARRLARRAKRAG